MEKTKKLVIFGTGEIGELASFYFTHDSEYEVVAFTADDEFVQSETFAGKPVVGTSRVVERFPPDQYDMHVALSYRKLNQIRQEKYELAKQLGYKLPSYICSKSVTWPDLSVGDNCFILENQTIQPTVKIGNNVMLWSGNHIGHGSVIEDHAYLASHVVLSGHTVIGERCFLGVNATVKDFTRVGKDSFITMGALITKDLPDGSVILGSQSTVFEADTKQAQVIKKKYFSL
jgi:sugar O-acyltransferase (sialic acid O-acetyltransferase NeuD family)